MAILFALLTGACFGGVLVSVRLAVTRHHANPAVGALVAAAIACVVVGGVAFVQGVPASARSPGDVWPYFLVGAVSPGASHSAFYPAIRLLI